MRIHHFAIWCDDIAAMRDFYTKYFDCRGGAVYRNEAKGFSSIFISFDDGCRIELMNRHDIVECASPRGFAKGLAHFDIEVGDEAAVDALTERFRNDGYEIVGEPRRTGDGYYEASVRDAEGNLVELSAI